jgi:hypothetical protein
MRSSGSLSDWDHRRSCFSLTLSLARSYSVEGQQLCRRLMMMQFLPSRSERAMVVVLLVPSCNVVVDVGWKKEGARRRARLI